MKRDAWLELLRAAVERIEHWESEPGPFALPAPDDAAAEALSQLTERLRGSYPFGHPRYAGQMLAPPHPVAWVAYATAMLINPNNHALDGGPATVELEREVVCELASLLGYSPERGAHLGHLSASGTIANLEALWVARQLHAPGRDVVLYGDNAHYTHARVCGVLGMRAEAVPRDSGDRIDPAALEARLERGDVGTVVVTLGTTGTGALDPLERILPLAQRYGARVHADCAYAGFFALLARREPPLVAAAPFAQLGGCDSIVVDPHKRGLQPYGCGAVLFRDPQVARLYAHDSPYTYFTSADLHPGEVTLECSRAGAAAAALWTTLRALPLEPHAGLGDLLAASRRAALAWAARLEQDERFLLLQEPDTDIVCFAPAPSEPTLSALSRASERLFQRATEDPANAVYLAKIRLPAELLAARFSGLTADLNEAVLLRSVLMKPEHEDHWPELHARLRELID